MSTLSRWSRRRFHFIAGLGWLGAAAVLLGGCAHRPQGGEEPARVNVYRAQPPPFLTGPAGALLTNGAPYSARVTASSPALGKPASGQLLARGAQLVFAPDPEETSARTPEGGFSFIWDVAQGRGYVLSEALQGYARLPELAHPIRLLTTVQPGSSRKMEAQETELARAEVEMTGGAAAVFEVWQTITRPPVPVEISSLTNTSVLRLSRVRREDPGPAAFRPPSDFTDYPYPEAMVDELATRQRMRMLRHE